MEEIKITRDEIVNMLIDITNDISLEIAKDNPLVGLTATIIGMKITRKIEDKLFGKEEGGLN